MAEDQRRVEIRCRRCRKISGGTANGWYQLSVAVPVAVNSRGYIWVGTFCSLACLAWHLPELERQDRQTADLYERDEGETDPSEPLAGRPLGRPR